MDTTLPLLETKNSNSGILNFVCKLSEMIRIIHIKSNITASEVGIQFKELIYPKHGLPSKIISDRDDSFISNSGKQNSIS